MLLSLINYQGSCRGTPGRGGSEIQGVRSLLFSGAEASVVFFFSGPFKWNPSLVPTDLSVLLDALIKLRTR